jgi:hypothetical protein
MMPYLSEKFGMTGSDIVHAAKEVIKKKWICDISLSFHRVEPIGQDGKAIRQSEGPKDEFRIEIHEVCSFFVQRWQNGEIICGWDLSVLVSWVNLWRKIC